jgi:hypothetical protein
MKKPLRTNNELRQVLKEKTDNGDSKFLSLLDKLRKHLHLSDTEKQELWLGVSDWVSNLARKHYGQKQKTGHYVKGVPRQWYEPIKGNYREYERHLKRMDVCFDFVNESSVDTPIKGVVFAFNRRFIWIEMLVELECLGINFDKEKTTTQRINSTVLRDLIRANRLARNFKDTHRRYPSYDELTVEYAKELLGKGKYLNYHTLQRFINRYANYQAAKLKADALLGYDEQRGGSENTFLLSDSGISTT